jgi:hypothetical protein
MEQQTIITGASDGIGAAAARCLASELRATYPAHRRPGQQRRRDHGRSCGDQGWLREDLPGEPPGPVPADSPAHAGPDPGQAKVLQTSSIAAQRYGHVDLDDLQNEKSYAPQKTYGTEGHRIRTQYPRSGAA